MCSVQKWDKEVFERMKETGGKRFWKNMPISILHLTYECKEEFFSPSFFLYFILVYTCENVWFDV